MKERNQALFNQMVIALASGQTLTAWCEDNGVNYSTAKRWKKTPEFQTELRELRAEMMDSAAGQLIAASRRLAEQVVKLAFDAVSESVRHGPH